MSTSRRVTNEITRDWTELYQENNTIYHIDLQPHSATFYMFLSENYEPILITLDFFHRSYPFKPPKVYIGIDKKEYLKNTRNKDEIDLMRLLKKSIDPKNILNPGRIL